MHSSIGIYLANPEAVSTYLVHQGVERLQWSGMFAKP